MCDFKKFWFWLALFALLILLILCTLTNTISIYNEQNPKNAPQTPTTQEVAKQPSKYSLDNTISNALITKNSNGITISGLFGSQKSVTDTFDTFSLHSNAVNRGDIEIREGVDDTRWIDVLGNLAYYFSNNIEDGELKYSKDGLFIDGSTLTTGAQQDIQLVLTDYQNSGLKTVDSVRIVEAKTVEQKTKKALYELLSVNNIEFENGKSHLKKDAFPLLDEIIKILRSNNSLHVTIEGHTDNSGNKALNEALSVERAHTVKNYFAQKGIEKERMSAKGYGQTRPILPNTTDTNRQKNRRVEFKVKGER